MGDRIMIRGLENIAKKILGLPTLETQNSDSLDFKDCAVWNLKAALEAAYKLGRDDERLRVLEHRRGT